MDHMVKALVEFNTPLYAATMSALAIYRVIGRAPLGQRHDPPVGRFGDAPLEPQI
jgi:hypothetical protein